MCQMYTHCRQNGDNPFRKVCTVGWCCSNSCYLEKWGQGKKARCRKVTPIKTFSCFRLNFNLPATTTAWTDLWGRNFWTWTGICFTGSGVLSHLRRVSRGKQPSLHNHVISLITNAFKHHYSQLSDLCSPPLFCNLYWDSCEVSPVFEHRCFLPSWHEELWLSSCFASCLSFTSSDVFDECFWVPIMY